MIITLACTITLLACNTLQQKWRSQLNAQQELNMTQLKQQQLEQNVQLRMVDSAFTGYQVLIKPKGKFSYSLVNGFVGEADSLLIKGIAMKETKIVYQNHMAIKATEETSAQAKQKSSTKELVKEKEKTGSWKLAIAALIGLALVVAYGLYRRR